MKLWNKIRPSVAGVLAMVAALVLSVQGAVADELPPPADHEIDFHREVLPILANRCVTCHASGRAEGSFSLETRSDILRESDSGQTVIPGDSANSMLIELVAGVDPTWVMPKQGKLLSDQEVGILRAWIDQGVAWDQDISLRKLTMRSWKPKRVDLPEAREGWEHPLDRLMISYFAEHEIDAGRLVDDATYARRVYYDVIGLPPTVEQLTSFQADTDPDKRAKLVRTLLDDDEAYAQHWLSFWNDLLRNDYAGTGFIDGGRKQITAWLYKSLYDNQPLDGMVSDLVQAAPGAEGFVHGIVWRGAVNASQRPPLQAAQNLSQVFLGVNLKCASCHDSFVSQWKLEDAYALAGVFSDKPLEMFECDKSLGRYAEAQFLNTELGKVSTDSDQTTRRREVAQLMTSPNNARLRRTIVNRFWGRFLGRGVIEPIDEIDNPAWHEDLLDYLAADLQAHDDNLKHAIGRILTSRAYQLPSVDTELDDTKVFVFRGPQTRRLTAEQFLDSLWMHTGTAPGKADAKLPAVGKESQAESPSFVRAALVNNNPLMTTLGRPNREQVVTTRPADFATLQALDLTNGPELNQLLTRGAKNLLAKYPDRNSSEWTAALYQKFLGRGPSEAEQTIALEILGEKPEVEGVTDLLWCLVMLPEFQLIR
ncbi:MAG: DUF1549 domain-containing protein [Pirellulaceae bacterium]